MADPDPHLIERINRLRVETPSWGYGNSGTRFKVFAQPGAARTVEEKLADAGLVHQLTGICPTVALHIPWDQVTDWKALKRVASSHGVATGAITGQLLQSVGGDPAARSRPCSRMHQHRARDRLDRDQPVAG